MTRNTSNASLVEPPLVESTLDSRRSRASDFGLFFRKFLSKGRTISSAVPSSRAMATGTLESVDFNRPGTIVELGAGTGPVTEEIIQRLRHHHRFVAVENDPDFCKVLRRRFPETPLIQADATQVMKPLTQMGIHKVDYVISGLPTPNLPARSMILLWKWLREALTPDGLFIQITVAPILYRSFYFRLFESVDYRMVWMNVPPGGIYRCSRPRRHLYKAEK
ncbi:MAG: NAD-binding protein [Phycisphaerales bacterium]|nr:NAD-binding protein [Phycisphaerales bacterium]